MNLHPPMHGQLRRAAWPAWPRRSGLVASEDRRNARARPRLDWPLLLFWGGYLAIVAWGVWLLVR